uniref:Glycoside hydrolase family 3 protein n=1 Tax=Mycena chlorophos TaxID=658473 RepID=A0ABQ0KWT7_MYCCL|nr:glycoside hydrolase family 3 protein [Mycena chlorophos]
MVGTWSLATTGEHVDLSDLGLVGAQLDLVKAVQGAGKPTVVVFVPGQLRSRGSRIVSSLSRCFTRLLFTNEVGSDVDAVAKQFYPGELGGLAIAEVLFGAVNPSGKLPVSFPRSVGTTPIFYNYLKGSRPISPGDQRDVGIWTPGTVARANAGRCSRKQTRDFVWGAPGSDANAKADGDSEGPTPFELVALEFALRPP